MKLLLNIACAILTFTVGVAGAKLRTKHVSSDFSVLESQVSGSYESPWCEPPTDIPKPIKVALDKRFPGWRFWSITREVCQFLKQEFGSNVRPEIISGDFDGNGRLDSAVLIQHGTLRTNGGTEFPNVHVVALMNTQKGYRIRTIEREGAYDYLMTMKKGEPDYNYESQNYFTYSNDAIFAGIFEKAGMSYVYENGRFRALITSD